MINPFGPVFTAEMITSSRRTRNLIVRVVYGLIILLALGTIYSDYGFAFSAGTPTVQLYATLASTFFQSFAILQLLGVVLVVPAITAGVIAQERERRTI